MFLACKIAKSLSPVQNPSNPVPTNAFPRSAHSSRQISVRLVKVGSLPSAAVKDPKTPTVNSSSTKMAAATPNQVAILHLTKRRFPPRSTAAPIMKQTNDVELCALNRRYMANVRIDASSKNCVLLKCAGSCSPFCHRIQINSKLSMKHIWPSIFLLSAAPLNIMAPVQSSNLTAKEKKYLFSVSDNGIRT